MAVAIFEHEATGQFGCSCVISISPVQSSVKQTRLERI